MIISIHFCPVIENTNPDRFRLQRIKPEDLQAESGRRQYNLADFPAEIQGGFHLTPVEKGLKDRQHSYYEII